MASFGRIVPQPRYCSAGGCVSWATAAGRMWCDRHQLIRDQHVMSHEMEGHPDRIKMCPICERLTAMGIT